MQVFHLVLIFVAFQANLSMAKENYLKKGIAYLLGDKMNYPKLACKFDGDYCPRECGYQAEGKKCPEGLCCSAEGWCGTTSEYCSWFCQKDFGVCKM